MALSPGRWVLAGLPTAALACVLGLAFSGAAAPTLIGDAGAVVRWGLPVVTVASHLAAALTLGGLVLLLFVLPRPVTAAVARGLRVRPDGGAWALAARVVSWAGPAWAVLLVVDLVLGYGSVAGRPLGGPGFGVELAYYVTEISTGRTALVTAVLAAAASSACVVVAGYGSAVMAAVAGFAVLIPLATTGHAAGAENHELGMSGLFGHLASASIWVGGLAVLCLVAPRLGKDLRAAVGRYSTVALWAFLGVGISGLAKAWLQLGSLQGVLTDYGLILVAKMVAFAVLGVFGYLHRERTMPKLRADGLPGGPFWRLAGVEVLVMAVATGLAVALGATGPPAPQPTEMGHGPTQMLSQFPVPPEPGVGRWFTQWTPDLLFGGLALVFAVIYLRWVLRLRRRGDQWPATRTASWLLAAGGLAWVTCGGPAVYGRIMFSAHMVQHMTLVTVLPIFFVLAAPVTLAVRALPTRADGSRGPREWLLGLVHSGFARFVGHPVIAAANFVGSVILFYFTPMFELSLATYLGHILMVVYFTLTGYLFVNVLIGIDPGPTRPSNPLRLLLLLATMAFHAFFGIALMSMTSVIAADHFSAPGLPWGVDALADQAAGGEIIWLIGGVPSLVLAVTLALAWSKDDTRTVKRRDRAVDRDDDAELKADNAIPQKMPQDT
ncbi:cytochrome c oxidase assembly protein [Occultella gossypii]|uniref:Bifunctional copper resistance protein CopD/cytochrome c oxidase assembly protein n=1 Tax=Occultella gossypii TaxID=2800820 RepID=A0ABS7SBS5_9MICO|nr:cytochrome c oxidase assembly protein [Occultella gossypii]MBZ2197139.1 bifunctional copper resistance protein CopD/cytochrome c oxidase assembly protein [Occultella gossypii]